MNQSLGKVITGLVTDVNEDAFFVQKDGVTYKLDKAEGMEYKLGDTVEGFAYISMDKDFMLTQDIPKAQVGYYAWGTVIDTRKDLGVFVDVGLPDKELVVSLDELPTIKQLWPKKGDRLLITIRVDDKDRMWGELASDEVYQSLAKKGTEELINQNIKGTAYRLKMIGTFILTEDNQIGFIHPSERKDEPRLGEVVSGRVIGVRPDGVINVSLMPRAYEAIGDDAAMLMAILERTKTGSFPYTDKSSPEDISDRFGISKGQFKRAIGNLMKQRLIVQEDGETKLVAPLTKVENEEDHIELDNE